MLVAEITSVDCYMRVGFLTIGFTSTVGMLLIGISIGVISGYFGGVLDTVLMRITEFVMLFPFLIFAIVLNAALGDKIKIPMVQQLF